MDKLLSYLKTYYGEDAQYRAGQEEAIRDVLQGKRTLVVQKTGWGKSLVYFMATRLIRESVPYISLHDASMQMLHALYCLHIRNIMDYIY